jgi:hypothetical protein
MGKGEGKPEEETPGERERERKWGIRFSEQYICSILCSLHIFKASFIIINLYRETLKSILAD